MIAKTKSGSTPMQLCCGERAICIKDDASVAITEMAVPEGSVVDVLFPSLTRPGYFYAEFCGFKGIFRMTHFRRTAL